MLKERPNYETNTDITSYQFHSYSPYTDSFRNQDEIRIVIQSQNSYVLPSDSYLYIEGEFVRDATALDAQVNPIKVPNWPSFLFDNIRYELNGTEIDRCKNVGITSSIKMYSTLTTAQYESLESAGIHSLTVIRNNELSFSLEIPLKLYLGCIEDYKQIVMNSKHELILSRARNDVDCFMGINDVLKISINKIQWRMPTLKVNDHLQLKLLKQIQSNDPIKMGYRCWDLFEYPSLPTTNRHVWAVKTSSHLTRPRYILLAFQTNKNNVINSNKNTFNHLNITDARVYLNSDVYPQESLQLNFASNRGAIAYSMYKKFRESYYNDTSGYNIAGLSSYESWLKSPIFVFDCCHQNEALKTSAVDIKIEFQCSENIPADTTAYCVIVHDNIVQYNPLTNIVVRNL